MIEDKYLELIHREIDGTITRLERARLSRFLAVNSEARELHRQLVELGRALSEAPQIEPPSRMRESIMHEVERRAQRQPPRTWEAGKESAWSRLAESVSARFRLHPAIPFAVGVAVGVLVLFPVANQLNRQGPIDPARVSGALLKEVVENPKHIDRKELTAGPVSGSIDLWSAPGWLFADLSVVSGGEVTLVLRYDNHDIGIYGLANLSQAATRVESVEGELRIAHHGNRQYNLVFTDDPRRVSDIRIRVESGGFAYEESVRAGE